MKFAPDPQIEAQRRRAEALLRDGPDVCIGGDVCVVTFIRPDGRKSFAIWHLSDSGTGWSSDSIDDLDLAWFGAELLAIKCQARMIDCGCREDLSP